MQLHDNKELFHELCLLTADWKKIPYNAVVKDYYITMLLKNLQNSAYGNVMLFKGGTSLSKCYNDVIQRFSEDIDLTYVPETMPGSSARKRTLVEIVNQVSVNFDETHIDSKGDKNITATVPFNSGLLPFEPSDDRIKLEIGSVVNYGCCEQSYAKSYVHDYLEHTGRNNLIAEFNLSAVQLSVLPIEITFLEKLYAIKTHTFQGNISSKSRHIYDVCQLSKHPRIKALLQDEELCSIYLLKVKEQSAAYYNKRNIILDYDIEGPYDFVSWKDNLVAQARDGYNKLYDGLIYGGVKLNFDGAVEILGKLGRRLAVIDKNVFSEKFSVDCVDAVLSDANSRSKETIKDSHSCEKEIE